MTEPVKPDATATPDAGTAAAAKAAAETDAAKTAKDAEAAAAALKAKEQTPDAAKAKETEAAALKAKEAEEAASKVFEKKDLKLAEKTVLDDGALDGIVAYSKAQGLSKLQAQALVDREEALVKSQVEHEQAFLKETNAKWLKDIKDSPDTGGTDAKFLENSAKVERVIATFFDKSFKVDLEATNLGNHPRLFRGLLKIANAMSEGTLRVPGAQPPPAEAPKSYADLAYAGTTGKKEEGK